MPAEKRTENVYGGLRFSVKAALSYFGFRAANDSERRQDARQRLYGGPAANKEFWEDTHSNNIWDGQPVVFDGVALAEWVPIQPGLYHTSLARSRREQARRFLDFNKRLGGHYTPQGKISMLEGGVGTCRLGRIGTAEAESQYLISATSTPWCEQGIPLVVSANVFESIIEDLRSLGAVRAKIAGRASLFGSNAFLSDTGRRFQPESFYVLAESVRIEPRPEPSRLIASAHITFSAVEGSSPGAAEYHAQWLTSFCQFRPGRLRQSESVDAAVEWFNQYVEAYGDPKNIVADFDAYNAYFQRPLLPLGEQFHGVLDSDVLGRLARLSRSNIVVLKDAVLGDRVEGDQYKNIKESTINNRSALVFESRPEG
jgi:hypothetical protein